MRRMLATQELLATAFVLGVGGSAAERPHPAVMLSPQWPDIAPSGGSVVFADGGKAAIDIVVMALSGDPQFVLRCLTVEPQPDASSVDYLGDFECRLLPHGSADDAPSLLRDSEVQSEWDSRGSFYRSELEGACGDYPEYGRRRHFRLRGMELTLELSDVRFRNGVRTQPLSELMSFRFRWSVRPDAGALSANAELPKVRDPLQKHSKGPTPIRRCGTITYR